jgi:hypothetical protein
MQQKHFHSYESATLLAINVYMNSEWVMHPTHNTLFAPKLSLHLMYLE